MIINYCFKQISEPVPFPAGDVARTAQILKNGYADYAFAWEAVLRDSNDLMRIDRNYAKRGRTCYKTETAEAEVPLSLRVEADKITADGTAGEGGGTFAAGIDNVGITALFQGRARLKVVSYRMLPPNSSRAPENPGCSVM